MTGKKVKTQKTLVSKCNFREARNRIPKVLARLRMGQTVYGQVY